MHFLFIPYGKRSCVDKLLNQMEFEKHVMPFTHPEKEEKKMWIEPQIRLCPLGVIEYVFPRESLDAVLATLDADIDRYKLGKTKMAMLRTIFKASKIPSFSKERKFLWDMESVNIIPIGIREDGTFTEVTGPFEGYTHEAI